MKLLKTTPVCLLCLGLSVILWLHPGRAQSDPFEPVGDYGYIDWLNQMVYAKGVGLPPKDKQNTTQARILARRAALVVAQRNLLEVIKGVHIDSTTLVENRIVQDERIVSRLKGAVQYCRVEDTRHLADNAVEMTVSMPLVGKLGEIIVQSLEGRTLHVQMGPAGDIQKRLARLESRVLALEQQLSRINDISLEQQRLRFLFHFLIETREVYNVQTSLIAAAGYASDTELSALNNKFLEYEKRLAAYGALLSDLSRRLDRLEMGVDASPPSTPAKPDGAYPYTGLVVDARRTAFKPCLKPEIFSAGQRIYPGDDLNLDQTIKNGYVRYYQNRQQAQQSERVGSLPYVVEAIGTPKGVRSLGISEKAASILSAIMKHPDNFLADGRVVIVF